MNPWTRRLAAGATAAIVAGCTLYAVGGLILVFTNLLLALLAAVVGWLLLTPLSAILVYRVLGGEADDELRRPPSTATGSGPSGEPAPVDRLRERYADGDIDAAEFERRLDLLVETEGTDPATARERVRERER